MPNCLHTHAFVSHQPGTGGEEMIMQPILHSFSRVHVVIFLAFYITFAAVTFLALTAGSPSDRKEYPIAAATLGTLSGPFTGAIARNFQSCCWEFSLTIFPYCALLLGVGVISQIVPLPLRRFDRPVRLTLWCLGLLGWFGGALVSFGHALS